MVLYAVGPAEGTPTWPTGRPVPAEALALLARDVGPPAAVEQAKEVYHLNEVSAEVLRC